MEEALVDRVGQATFQSWERHLLAFLLKDDGAPATAAAIRLLDRQLSRCQPEDMSTSGGGSEAWTALAISLDRLSGYADSAFVPFLTSVGQQLGLADSYKWSQNPSSPEYTARTALELLSCIDHPDAVASVHRLLTDVSGKVRQSMADGAITAILRGQGEHLVRALGTWADTTLARQPGYADAQRLAWVIFAAQNDNAFSYVSQQPVPDDFWERRAWILALSTATTMHRYPEASERLRSVVSHGLCSYPGTEEENALVSRHVYRALVANASIQDWEWLKARAIKDVDAAQSILEGVADAKEASVHTADLVHAIVGSSTDTQVLRQAMQVLGRLDVSNLDMYVRSDNADIAALAQSSLAATQLETQAREVVALSDKEVDPVDRIARLIDAWDRWPSQRDEIEILLHTSLQQFAQNDAPCAATAGVLEKGERDGHTPLTVLIGVEPYRVGCLGTLSRLVAAFLKQACIDGGKKAVWEGLRMAAFMVVMGDSDTRKVILEVLEGPELVLCLAPEWAPKVQALSLFTETAIEFEITSVFGE